MMRFWLILLLVLGGGSAADAQSAPGPVGKPEGIWRAQIHWVPLDIAGTRYLLYTRVCRPQGEEPARIVVFAHGTPAVAQRPGMQPLTCEGEAARWFLGRGYVVIASMRRGYGQTGGYWGDGFASCATADYFTAGLETARDIAATLEYAATLPFARPTGMILVGHSAGGWGTIAYNATPHPRVTALVNMAGGRGGHQQGRANNNCRPEDLAAAAGRFARTSITPMLWIYAANDSYFAPPIATALYTAYTSNGGKAELHQLPAFGSDGHQLLFGSGGSRIWGPLVERYIASQRAQ
jgi:dienelactone hydrolase